LKAAELGTSPNLGVERGFGTERGFASTEMKIIGGKNEKERGNQQARMRSHRLLL